MAIPMPKPLGNNNNTTPASGAHDVSSQNEPQDSGRIQTVRREDVHEGLSRSEQRRGDSASNDDIKSRNTGNITTAANRTDASGFTHPQHDMSAPGRNESSRDFAGGVTTATNRTTDSGFTSPGGDMGGARSSSR
ncbi:hypothetical protein NQ176_g4327 [Zarea fungicola]|uniref:Uncharacterized protein n=1 Tax=Zarea fungicola TaxID=93591 RepID=A0ACC1NDX7_9HYPO|nr:hypothetical protein NQ176_g4327 [Lecanicillium fungicola]